MPGPSRSLTSPSARSSTTATSPRPLLWAPIAERAGSVAVIAGARPSMDEPGALDPDNLLTLSQQGHLLMAIGMIDP